MLRKFSLIGITKSSETMENGIAVKIPNKSQNIKGVNLARLNSDSFFTSKTKIMAKDILMDVQCAARVINEELTLQKDAKADKIPYNIVRFVLRQLGMETFSLFFDSLSEEEKRALIKFKKEHDLEPNEHISPELLRNLFKNPVISSNYEQVKNKDSSITINTIPRTVSLLKKEIENISLKPPPQKPKITETTEIKKGNSIKDRVLEEVAHTLEEVITIPQKIIPQPKK